MPSLNGFVSIRTLYALITVYQVENYYLTAYNLMRRDHLDFDRRVVQSF